VHHQLINTAAGQERTNVGHDLQSCTAEIMPVCATYPADPNAHVVFIDTPGFDDTDVSDITILERVSEWLIKTSAFLCCLLFQLTQRGSSYERGEACWDHLYQIQQLKIPISTRIMRLFGLG
jgi:GTPase Era involved in 16S rRNA processing